MGAAGLAAALAAVAAVPYGPALAASIPALVSDERLPRATSSLSARSRRRSCCLRPPRVSIFALGGQRCGLRPRSPWPYASRRSSVARLPATPAPEPEPRRGLRARGSATGWSRSSGRGWCFDHRRRDRPVRRRRRRGRRRVALAERRSTPAAAATASMVSCLGPAACSSARWLGGRLAARRGPLHVFAAGSAHCRLRARPGLDRPDAGRRARRASPSAARATAYVRVRPAAVLSAACPTPCWAACWARPSALLTGRLRVSFLLGGHVIASPACAACSRWPAPGRPSRCCRAGSLPVSRRGPAPADSPAPAAEAERATARCGRSHRRPRAATWVRMTMCTPSGRSAARPGPRTRRGRPSACGDLGEHARRRRPRRNAGRQALRSRRRRTGAARGSSRRAARNPVPRVPITASRSPITAVAVSSPPAPGPSRITSRIESPRSMHGVERALDRRQRVVRRRAGRGATRAQIAVADPSASRRSA